MVNFFNALSNPELLFLRYALVAGIISSVSFGIIGSYVVSRRISYIAGAIAHSALGGIGAGLYFNVKMNIAWFTPLAGALVASLLSGFIIGMVSIYLKEREDTVIGAVWALGMAVGLLLFSKTPGYIEPMSYLFGNILLIGRNDLFIIGSLDAVIVLSGVLFYNKFLAVCFDEEFAKSHGIKVGFYYILLLTLTALTVVLMVTLVGIVMVIALLTLPAAVASIFSKSMWQMMLVSSVLCMIFIFLGLATSYIYNLPTGSNIILLASGFYILSIFVNFLLRRKRI